MRNFVVFILIFFFFFSCNEENEAQNSVMKNSIFDTILIKQAIDKSILDSISMGIKFFPSGTYESSMIKINNRRHRYSQELSEVIDSLKRDSIVDDARNYFTKSLLNEIVPHWYGTVWDFDGYTNIPNEGVIACGYFVSTTLKHMGINVNRYKLAQQAGLNEAKTLSAQKDLLIYNVETTEDLDLVFNKMKKTLKDGLYFVGLSNHVGYIFVKNKNIYFLHSNYIDGYVMIEKAEYSDAFSSSIYVIADITYNDNLILKWINNNPFEVVKE